jgi:hypothetical protein
MQLRSELIWAIALKLVMQSVVNSLWVETQGVDPDEK